MEQLLLENRQAKGADKVQQIYRMMESGYVSVVCAARLSLIQVDKMILEHEHPDKGLAGLYSKYWKPFVVLIYYHYTAIGICPYFFVRRNFTLENGETRSTKVPIALERGSFHVSASMADNGEKVYTITPNQKITHKIRILHSKYRMGLTTSNSAVDSDCGRIVDRWMWLRDRQVSADAFLDSVLRPMIWIQQNPVKSSDVDLLREQEIARYTTNPYGYQVPKLPEPDFDVKKRFVVVPPEMSLCQTQPRLEPSMANLDGLERAFNELVDVAFCMPVQNARTDGSAFHSRSQSAVDESRSTKSAAINEIIADITIAVQEVFALVYEDTPAVNVSIPTRALVDLSSIFTLKEQGMIDHQLAQEEALKIVGIHPNRVDSTKRVKLLDSEED